MRNVVLLGCTGSIGTSTIKVAEDLRDCIRLVGLAAGNNAELLLAQARKLQPAAISIADPSRAQELRDLLGGGMAVFSGAQGLVKLATLPEADIVLIAIVGTAGLQPALAAIRAGKDIAVASKEILVMAGEIVMREAQAHGARVLTVDSEHSALAQCLRGGRRDEVRRLILTASGGPFRGRTREELAGVTVQEALAHPTWDMGPVVTINSASLMNKGLELIEAHLLFDVPLERIDVVVHPQSVVHSMVEFVDGSTIAQASPPDMRLPIALGMAWPDRVPDAAPACDWSSAATWEFFPLDDEAFPAVGLASRAAAAGGIAPAVLNAANEQAVAAFREARIGFLGITELVDRVMQETLPSGANRGNRVTLEDVLDADAWARGLVRGLIEEDV